jgi:hypothetical protein
LFLIDVSVVCQRAYAARVQLYIRIVTDVSPFLNLPSVAEPCLRPRRSHTPSTSLGWEDPLNMRAPRMVGGPSSVTFSYWPKCGDHVPKFPVIADIGGSEINLAKPPPKPGSIVYLTAETREHRQQ